MKRTINILITIGIISILFLLFTCFEYKFSQQKDGLIIAHRGGRNS